MKTPFILVLPGTVALAASDDTFFETRIRPVLVEHGYECHSVEAGKSKGGLQLDTREGIRTGGDTGPAVVPGASVGNLVDHLLESRGFAGRWGRHWLNVARYAETTGGDMNPSNASTLINAPDAWELSTVAPRMDPAEWQRKKTQLYGLIKQRDAALASRRPGARSSEGSSERTGFEVVCIITQSKRIQVELDACHPDGSPKPRVIGVLNKPTTAPPVERSARRMGGDDLTSWTAICRALFGSADFLFIN